QPPASPRGGVQEPPASPGGIVLQPPASPRGIEGRLAFFFLHAFAPRVPRVLPEAPPPQLGEHERFDAPHALRREPLHATWFPALARPRGAVLLAHPWLSAGQAYFHRYRRIPVLRETGYHVLTFDFPGFGGSGRLRGYFDTDLEQMVDVLARRAPGLPWHFW